MRYFILTILFSSQIGQSQVIIEPCIGFNYSWIQQLDQLGYDYSPGYRPAFGIGTNLDINYRLSFVPKILYSAKGNKEKVGTGTLLRIINYNTYISVPLELKYILKNNFHISAGVATGFWIKSSAYSKSETGNWRKSVYDFNNGANSTFQKDNRFELAARLGVRFDSPFMDGKLKWEFSFNYGLVPLVQPYSPAPNYEYNYNRWVQLLLVYPLNLYSN